MSERRVLFIVEGEKAESRFLKNLHVSVLGSKPENIFTYGGSIHNLLNRLSKEGNLEDLDLLAVLRESCNEPDRDILYHRLFRRVPNI